tara:strand:+ start:12116 stop:12253 length:138 start_codon:yes stop_codon:yes gene_type:complete
MKMDHAWLAALVASISVLLYVFVHEEFDLERAEDAPENQVETVTG